MHRSLDLAIDVHAEEAIAFLSALVGAPSTVGREQAALALFATEATSLGMVVDRLPFSNPPSTESRAGIAPPSSLLSADRFQVLATTPGTGTLHLLLNGHMDVVPADQPGLWASPPFAPQRRNGRLYGRGAADMKSGFAVGALALRALRDVAPDLFKTRRLGFLAVIEEECTGNGTLLSLAEHGIAAPEVVVLEPTNLGLLIGGVGVLWIRLGVFAASGHARAADAHQSALDLGLLLLAQLRQWSADLRSSHPEPSLGPDVHPYAINLGRVTAGDWTSSTPAAATFEVRIGFPRSWTPDEAEGHVRRIVSAFAAEVSIATPPTVELTGFRAQGYLIDAGSALVRDLAAAHQDAHGISPVVALTGSTTDARIYWNDFGIPAVCFGAVGHDLHGIDESVDLASITHAARTLARFLLMRFAGDERPA